MAWKATNAKKSDPPPTTGRGGGSGGGAPSLADIMGEELAHKLQLQEEREAGLLVVDSDPIPGVTVEEADAAALQAETPGSAEEAEQFVRDEELARALQAQEEEDAAVAVSAPEEEEEEERMRPRQQQQQQRAAVVTKHDAEVCGRRNAAALSVHVGGEMGDLGSEVILPNPAYNALRERSRRDETRAARRREAMSAAGGGSSGGGGRRHDGGDRSDAVLDDATRLTLLGLLNTGVIAQLGGVVGQGKEARIFAATSDDGSELAIKVFRSTGELRSRVEYADGELLRELSRDRPHSWRIVRLWAQRELRTLAKLNRLGTEERLRSPEPIGLYGGNVLVMRFVGAGKIPALTLHDAVDHGDLKPQNALRKAMAETALAIRTMYQRCNVVHADLSEFNLLYHAGHVVVIDVAQSVPSTHHNAIPFLRRDCAAITAFFRRCGAPAVLSARELFLYATDESIATDADEAARLVSLMQNAEARGAPSREQIAEDDTFAKSDFGERPEVSAVEPASELEIAPLAPDGEEDDEVLDFLAEQLTGANFPLGTLSDGTQLSRVHRKQHMSACFPRIRELGMSHVARIGGDIVGVLLMDDLAAPPPTTTSANLEWLATLGPIAELNAAAKAPILSTSPPSLGEVAYCSWGGVAASARTHGVLRQLLTACLAVAKSHGFKRALGVCVSEWARRSFANTGFSEVHRVSYADFEIARMPASGTPGKPFANVPAPHVAAITMHKLL